ncbi:MAG: aldehyde dehydrogenase family protein [Anaerolineae bacterium]|nr:aldehyde dehydrogenase family protein [Anaerolineae bacterium]
MLFNGNWVDRPRQMSVYDPQDGSLIDTVPRASNEDMVAAIEAAVAGAQRARCMPTHQRIALLSGAASWIEQRQEEYARTIALEGIKTIREARKEASRCVDTLRISAEEARRVTGETIPFDQRPGSEHRFGYYVREPIGIIGAITPFNDPLNLVAHKVGPALAGGNAIIVKPHSETPLSALRLAEAFDQTGLLPRGVLQVITGRGSEIGNQLVTDPRVHMVSFTGGMDTGEEIAHKAGLKKLGMELGSNSPVIIMPDADIDLAVTANVSGAFWAAGQNCLHVQRLLVHDAIYDLFVPRFVSRSAEYRVGDKMDEETDMGPLINEAAACRVEKMVAQALDAGATLLTGGRRNGAFFEATVLADVPDTCLLAREEVYGPITVVRRFHSLDEAITVSNSVNYGLHAGIFTRDLQAAFRAAKELRCGGVMVNESTDYRIDAMPFGGVKGSGLGREGIRFALQEMTEPKVVCFNL